MNPMNEWVLNVALPYAKTLKHVFYGCLPFSVVLGVVLLFVYYRYMKKIPKDSNYLFKVHLFYYFCVSIGAVIGIINCLLTLLCGLFRDGINPWLAR